MANESNYPSSFMTHFVGSDGKENWMFGYFSFGVDEFVGRPQAMGFLFGSSPNFPRKVSTLFDPDGESAKSQDIAKCLQKMKSLAEDSSTLPIDEKGGRLYFAFYRNDTENSFVQNQYDGRPADILLTIAATAFVEFFNSSEEWSSLFTDGHLDSLDPGVLDLAFRDVLWLVPPEQQKVDFPIPSYRNPMPSFYEAQLLLESSSCADLGLSGIDDMDFPSFLSCHRFSAVLD